MLILFGTKGTRKVIGQTKWPWNCDHCNNQRTWAVVKDRNWFTLFFLPVIPLNTTQSVICPICGRAIRIDRNNRDEIMPMLDMDE